MSLNSPRSHSHSWNLPNLACKCSKRVLVQKFCLDPDCKGNNLFGENCQCSFGHLTSHPENIFEIGEFLNYADELQRAFKNRFKESDNFSTLNLKGKSLENEDLRSHLSEQFGLIDSFFSKLKEEICNMLDQQKNDLKDELSGVLACFERLISTLDHKIQHIPKISLFKILNKELLSFGKLSQSLGQVKKTRDLESLLTKVSHRMQILLESEKDQTYLKFESVIKDFHNFIERFREQNFLMLPTMINKAFETESSVIECIDPNNHISEFLNQIKLTQKMERSLCLQKMEKFTEDFESIILNKSEGLVPERRNSVIIRKSSCDLDLHFVKRSQSFATDLSISSLDSFGTSLNLTSSPALHLSMPDYFEETEEGPILYQLVEGTNTILSLSVLKYEAETDWKFKELHLENFQIPTNSSSVIIPSGRLFLCGGETGNHLHKDYTAATVEIDLKTGRVIQHNLLLIKRRSSGICYVDGDIYMIGGYNKGYLRSCEKYNIQTGQWTEIAGFRSLGMSSMGVCAFNNKYLYKFGGETEGLKTSNCIEKYDIERNSWELLQIKPRKNREFLLGCNPGCTQINNNQIYVFGGKDDLSLHNSNFILQVDKEQNGRLVEKMIFSNQFVPPVRDNFKPLSKVVIHKNIIFAQTTKKRKLMSFDGSQWTILSENYSKFLEQSLPNSAHSLLLDC